MYQYLFLDSTEKELIDDVIKNYIKPNPILRSKKLFLKSNHKPVHDSFWNLSWQDLILIRKAIINEDILELLKIVYEVSEKQFLKLEVFNVFSCYKWIVERLEVLKLAEEERLHSEMTNEEIEAGAEELQEYDYYNSLKAMCPDLLKHDDYLKLSYSIVFREMAHSKLTNDINRKFQENAARKNKRNRT